jgi:hypothetical protein
MVRTRYHDPSDSIFSRAASNCYDPIENFESDAEILLANKHSQDEKLHQELMRLAGSEENLDLAIERAVEVKSRTTAKRLGVHASTVSRRGREVTARIKIGIMSMLIHAQLVRHGHVIVTTDDPRSIDPKRNAFAVSIAGYGEQLTAIPNQVSITNWLNSHWPSLQSAVECADGNLRIPHIHVWFRDGKGEINLAVVVEDESTAKFVALENNQRIVHDIATGRIIDLQVD